MGEQGVKWKWVGKGVGWVSQQKQGRKDLQEERGKRGREHNKQGVRESSKKGQGGNGCTNIVEQRSWVRIRGKGGQRDLWEWN